MKFFGIEKITDFKWLNMFTIKFEDMKHNLQSWQVASRNDLTKGGLGLVRKADAVVVVGYHKDLERIALIKEFRVPLFDYIIELPAGLISKDETAEEAGIREFKEETGLTVTKVLAQSPTLYSAPGMTDESVIMLYVECEGEPSTEHNEDQEDIEVLLMSREEVINLLNGNCAEIRIGAKCWFAMDCFAKMGEI